MPQQEVPLSENEKHVLLRVSGTGQDFWITRFPFGMVQSHTKMSLQDIQGVMTPAEIRRIYYPPLGEKFMTTTCPLGLLIDIYLLGQSAITGLIRVPEVRKHVVRRTFIVRGKEKRVKVIESEETGRWITVLARMTGPYYERDVDRYLSPYEDQ